jgi:hypothetical protein
MVVTFEPMGPGAPTAGIVAAGGGRFVDGHWVPARRLDGDQTRRGRHVSIAPGAFGVRRVQVYRYR